MRHHFADGVEVVAAHWRQDRPRGRREGGAEARVRARAEHSHAPGAVAGLSRDQPRDAGAQGRIIEGQACLVERPDRLAGGDAERGEDAASPGAEQRVANGQRGVGPRRRDDEIIRRCSADIRERAECGQRGGAVQLWDLAPWSRDLTTRIGSEAERLRRCL